MSGSVAAWPWNDSSSSDFPFSRCVFGLCLALGGPYAFAIPASKGGEGASQRAGQTLPLKHLIVHLLNILCTDIGQIINLFLYLFIYLFFSVCSLKLYSRKVYLQRGEGKGGNLEVQNPKEYLRYKYKYILNNNLYHALSMSESTVDRHVCMFLH